MVLCVVAKHVKSSWCDVAMITFPGMKMDDSIRFNWRNNDPQVEKTETQMKTLGGIPCKSRGHDKD